MRKERQHIPEKTPASAPSRPIVHGAIPHLAFLQRVVVSVNCAMGATKEKRRYAFGIEFAPNRPGMNALTLFGLVAVSLMLVCYALENRSPHFVLAFAWACVMASAYGFLQGAWPFGLVEGVWSVIALRRWWRRAGRCPGFPPAP